MQAKLKFGILARLLFFKLSINKELAFFIFHYTKLNRPCVVMS